MPRVKKCGGLLAPRVGRVRQSDGYQKAWGECVKCRHRMLACHFGNGAGYRYFAVECEKTKCDAPRAGTAK